jgi:hypothetical protein
MKLIIKTEADIVFQVAYFSDAEGGMDMDVFGKPVFTLEEALEVLRTAQLTRSSEDWVIEVRAKFSTTEAKQA